MHMSVTYASQHNATAQIAEVVASVRRQPDDERSTSTVDVRAVENVDEMEDYDTLILGSAIYNGRWLPSARHFARGWLQRWPAPAPGRRERMALSVPVPTNALLLGAGWAINLAVAEYVIRRPKNPSSGTVTAKVPDL